tara:strand:- start:797 stop:1570 length:774 start_codon:yes stop_codon:yes gene_type:complete
MLKRIFTTALAAGILAGLLLSVIQEFTTTPLILAAEKYETGTAEQQALWNPDRLNQTVTTSPVLGYDDGKGRFYRVTEENHETEGTVWGPENGLERSFYTALTNVITGVSFASMLVAAFVFSGEKLTGRRGIIWGMAGFAVFTLSPSLGLPPEAPGAMSADLASRQLWWVGTAIATAAGLWLLVFGKQLPRHLLGLLLLLLPHVIGAPQPNEIGGNAPPELAAHFASSVIVVSGIFWVTLGWIAGTLWQRSEDPETT